MDTDRIDERNVTQIISIHYRACGSYNKHGLLFKQSKFCNLKI